MEICQEEAKKKATEELFYCEHVKRSAASAGWRILNLYCPHISILDLEPIWAYSLFSGSAQNQGKDT